MNKPIISINILSYNQKDLIVNCIEGILEQKTTYPYEIRIYDDCSTDGSQELLKEYEKKYPDRIKIYQQKENTFLKPYNQSQSYQMMQNVDTKYFSIIESDDYWCDENKLQTALDFLENNPEYSGWAHDCLLNIVQYGNKISWVHDASKQNTNDKITMDTPERFLYPDSRIFRNYDFKTKKLIPIDYRIYYFQLSKGPIHYHDKIMSIHRIGTGITNEIKDKDLCSTFAYKLASMFDFKLDEYCMKIQKYNDKVCGISSMRYNLLCLFKKVFGIKYGWTIWFFLTFAPRYGMSCFDPNWNYARKNIQKTFNKNSFKRQNKKQDNKPNELLKIFEEKNNLYKKDKKNISIKLDSFKAAQNFINYCIENENFEELNKFLSACDVPISDAITCCTIGNQKLINERLKKMKQKRTKFQILFIISLVINIVLISFILLKKFGVI